MKRHKLKKKGTLFIAVSCCMAMLLSSCSPKTAEDPMFYSNSNVIKLVKTNKKPDYWPTAEWKTSTPEQQGMSSADLAAWIDGLGELNVHSFLIARNGYIVAEGYNSAVDKDTKQEVKSVTKSVTSALTGLAIEEKKLAGVDKTLGDFFPETAQEQAKSKITLSQLLIMRSGLAWDNTNEISSMEMLRSPNWQQYVLGKPVSGEPGTTYNYSNGNAVLMGLVVEKATGEKLQSYAAPRLFAPLGITDFSWSKDPQGHDNGAFGLSLKTRDMAKLGLLYLHDGEWDGKQVVPKKWVEQSISKGKDQQYSDGTLGGYGYFWWMKKVSAEAEEGLDDDVFFAAGSEGQRVFVIPQENMVIAMTSDNAKDAFMPEKQLPALVSAVRSNKPLTPDAAAEARLQQAVKSFKAVTDKAGLKLQP